VHKQIAGIFLRTGRFKEAIPHLQSALSITKGSAAEYGDLARMMIESDENEVAVKFLTDTAYLFPEAADFPFLLTFPLARLEQWGEAVKQFEKTIALAGDEQPQLLNEQFYFRYAAAHERNGNFPKAEELFRKTIEMIAKNDPDDENQGFTATVYNYLGYMWVENDIKIDEAGELIKTAAELDPESGAIADSLGWFYFKRGQFEKAHDELLRAETLIEEQDAVIFDHIGQAFYQLDEAERAIEYLEKAVALEPGKTEYSDRLQRMRDGTEKKLEPTATEPAAPAAPAAKEGQN
jgi:tetratricopeptide (TPR) repeat protein